MLKIHRNPEHGSGLERVDGRFSYRRAYVPYHSADGFEPADPNLEVFERKRSRQKRPQFRHNVKALYRFSAKEP